MGFQPLATSIRSGWVLPCSVVKIFSNRPCETVSIWFSLMFGLAASNLALIGPAPAAWKFGTHQSSVTVPAPVAGAACWGVAPDGWLAVVAADGAAAGLAAAVGCCAGTAGLPHAANSGSATAPAAIATRDRNRRRGM